MNPLRYLLLAGLLMTAAVAGCADDDSASGQTDAEESPDVVRGRALAGDLGCAGCHGADGEGLVGPPWVGLAGSSVPQDDGSVLVADADYLRTAITDPDRNRQAATVLSMPAFDLPPDQLDALVAYIESLS